MIKELKKLLHKFEQLVKPKPTELSQQEILFALIHNQNFHQDEISTCKQSLISQADVNKGMLNYVRTVEGRMKKLEDRIKFLEDLKINHVKEEKVE